MKKYRGLVILTSVLTLLPMLAGLLLWSRLPETIATHWNAEGAADGWSSRGFAVFGLPLIVLAVHMICAFATKLDPKNRDQTAKIMELTLWICPVISLFSATVVLSTAMGLEINMALVAPLLLGLMFVIIGNYLPKCKQNHTIGIKISWTLHSEENWNRTHRFAGKVWVAGGLLILLGAFVTEGLLWLLLPVLIVMVALPFIYSYRIYKQENA